MDIFRIKIVIKKVNEIIFYQIFKYIKALGKGMQDERNMLIYQIKNLRKQSNNLAYISKILEYNYDTELEEYIINILNLIYEYIDYICDEIINLNTIMVLSESRISFFPNRLENNNELDLIYNDSIDSMIKELKIQKYNLKKK